MVLKLKVPDGVELDDGSFALNLILKLEISVTPLSKIPSKFESINNSSFDPQCNGFVKWYNNCKPFIIRQVKGRLSDDKFIPLDIVIKF